MLRAMKCGAPLVECRVELMVGRKCDRNPAKRKPRKYTSNTPIQNVSEFFVEIRMSDRIKRNAYAFEKLLNTEYYYCVSIGGNVAK